MADKTTSKQTGGRGSRRPATPPTTTTSSDDSLSPLLNNTFDLAPGERRTSNPRFGPIGGPSPAAVAHDTTGGQQESGFVLPVPHSQLGQAFRHVTTLANLTPSASSSSTQRVLRSNQPGNSYVTSLANWRRGPDQPVSRPSAPAAPRPAAARLARPARPAPAVPRPAAVAVPRTAPVAVPTVTFPPSRPAAPVVPRVEDRPARPVARRDPAPVKSRAVVARGGFDVSSAAYRGLNARAPVFETRAAQQQKQKQTSGSREVTLYRPRETFKPMNVMLDPEAAFRPLSDEEKRYRDEHGISYNYRGDSRNPTNESADIPDEDNCSVWITRLPPDCTYLDLLTSVAVHRPGKVFASVISPPQQAEPSSERILASTRTSAAKIVFYKADAAKHLIRAAERNQFVVNGYRAYVIPNKIKVAPQPETTSPTSRCVWITGPTAEVNVAELTVLFNRYFRWETEEIVVRGEPVLRDGEMHQTLEWRFASYHCQAGSAIATIKDYRHAHGVRACYSLDPCE